MRSYFIFGFSNEFCRNNLQTEDVSGNSSVWLKEKWNPGEVKGLYNYICAIYAVSMTCDLHNDFVSFKIFCLILSV